MVCTALSRPARQTPTRDRSAMTAVCQRRRANNQGGDLSQRVLISAGRECLRQLGEVAFDGKPWGERMNPGMYRGPATYLGRPRRCRGSFAICIAALLTASGCARHGLSTEEAALLIKRYRTDHCRSVDISLQPGDVGAHSAAETVTTLLRGMRAERKVQTVVSSGFGDYRTESVTFREGDVTQRAELTEMHHPDKSSSDKIGIRGCMFVPTRVEISDIVLQSPTAQVLFSEHLGLSPLGRRVNSLQLLERIDGSKPSEAHEFHFRAATLNFDTRADGWVVSAIGVGT
jgi:hypothetical protein